MFTGIVHGTAAVVSTEPIPAGIRVVLNLGDLQFAAGEKDSVCVNGVCLTVVARAGSLLTFDIIPETLRLTNLGALRPGDPANVEPSMTAFTEFGGHLVQGHVECAGTVVDPPSWGNGNRLRIAIGNHPEVAMNIHHKGYACINGVSLTVAWVNHAAGEFEVALIPETLKRTNLSKLSVGGPINLETDILTRSASRLLAGAFARIEALERQLPKGTS